MNPLKIAILGTRGIPNQYGGFEQFAEFLSVYLVQKGHSVSVYNSHNHSYRNKEWKGVQIIHCYDPEEKIGTAGQFIYDFNCIVHARKKKYDVILFLGYTSSSVWWPLYPNGSLIISNMDGLEWKRTKYSRPVKMFLKYAERLAVKHSNVLIADSPAIQAYLNQKYNVASACIAYGADVVETADEQVLKVYGLAKRNYFMLIARMEPENNIEMILDGFVQSRSDKNFIVIGGTKNGFGKYIESKFKEHKRIIFAGSVYSSNILHALKYYCLLYFHGHSVGGTNPSLLEAMASSAPVAAHANEFNKAVLGKDAFYFADQEEVCKLIKNIHRGETEEIMVASNLTKIRNEYSMDGINAAYEQQIVNSFYKVKND